MRHHADSMRYDRMYTLLWIYAAALALFGLFLGPLDQILPGLATIVLTEDALITDYVLIAGPGAALINSALVTAVTLVMLRLSHEPFNGFSLVWQKCRQHLAHPAGGLALRQAPPGALRKVCPHRPALHRSGSGHQLHRPGQRLGHPPAGRLGGGADWLYPSPALRLHL